MKECEVCGGDPAIAEIAIAMGHRPDVAFLEVRKGNRRIEELERRLELMWGWLAEGSQDHFIDDHPRAADWFDEEGDVK